MCKYVCRSSAIKYICNRLNSIKSNSLLPFLPKSYIDKFQKFASYNKTYKLPESFIVTDALFQPKRLKFFKFFFENAKK